MSGRLLCVCFPLLFFFPSALPPFVAEIYPCCPGEVGLLQFPAVGGGRVRGARVFLAFPLANGTQQFFFLFFFLKMRPVTQSLPMSNRTKGQMLVHLKWVLVWCVAERVRCTPLFDDSNPASFIWDVFFFHVSENMEAFSPVLLSLF